MIQDGRETVSVSRLFMASPERVYDAWLDPRGAARWLFATPEGETGRVDIDPRVGGRFTLVERRGGVDVEHVGEYDDLRRPRHIGFWFLAPRPPGEPATHVGVTIAPRGGGCELSLVHRGVRSEDAERTDAGWRGVLDGLAAALDEAPRLG